MDKDLVVFVASCLCFFSFWFVVKRRLWIKKPFINKSGLSEEQLMQYWKEAQKELSDGILTDEEKTHFKLSHSALSRARSITPRAVLVQTVPDILFSELVKLVTPVRIKGDPTGTFVQSGRFLVGVTSYPVFGPPIKVRFVTSVPWVLTHEFKHAILKLL